MGTLVFKFTLHDQIKICDCSLQDYVIMVFSKFKLATGERNVRGRWLQGVEPVM